MRTGFGWLLFGVLAGGAVARAGPASDPSATEFFEAKIRPILSDRCYKCHSGTAGKIQGGLRLDSLAALLKGGENGPAVVPGNPDKSRLIEAVRYRNPDLQMPPKSRLSAEQVAALTRWVTLGAPWPAEPPPADGTVPLVTAPLVTALTRVKFDLAARRNSHWAWQRVRVHEPPAVKNAAWPATPIDRFVLHGLESAGLEPAPAADRRSLVRRVYAVLVGLPPTPEEVDAFVADASPHALEKLVDRLLASPQFGERWARHWMDLVRYSDTLGNEDDAPIPNAWRYRDYLIRAFNADVPYDQFVLEHIAGDRLREPRRNPADGGNESIIATGFFWMNEGKHSPVDLRAAEADCFDNKLDVMCKTFLGLTVSCARCHDHKFDAISSRDYYALYGYLKSSRYTQAELNQRQCDAAASRLAMLRLVIRQVAPDLLAQRAATIGRYLEASLESDSRPLDAVAADAGLNPARLREWVAALGKPLPDEHPLMAWKKMAELGHAPTRAAGLARWEEIVGRLKDIARHQRFVKPRAGDVELADFGRGYGGWFVEDQAFGPTPLRPGDIVLGTSAERPIATVVHGGAWANSGYLSRRLEGTLRSPTFTIDHRYLHVLAAGRAARINVNIEHFVMIQDPLYGGLRKVLDSDVPSWQTFDLSMWNGRRAYLEFADTTTQDLQDVGPPKGAGPLGYLTVGRVVLSDEGPPEPPAIGPSPSFFGNAPIDSPHALAARYQRIVIESLSALGPGELPDQADAEPRAVLLAWLVEHGLLGSIKGDDDPALAQRLDGLLREYRDAESHVPAPIRAPATVDGTGEDEYLFIRGDYKQAGPVVPRRFLTAIGIPSPPASKSGSGRLELAREMIDPRNPLVARVMVNRIWGHVFGRGIVPSVDNFGALGDRPTNPELLDYLTDRFVREGWSIKRTIREMLLSRTFQMASGGQGFRGEALRADRLDPQNRLLHRMEVRRLEAEVIRDHMLAISGRLDRTMFGPGIEVFLTPAMLSYGETGGRPKESGPLDGDGRRSLYLKVRRNFLTPTLVAFDLPPPLNTAGRRTESNVPAQALILLNDPFVAHEARGWAQRIVARDDLDSAGKVRRMYAEAFARPPTEAELRIALMFLDHHGELLGISPIDRASDPRLWADLAHVLMNVKEFIYLK